MSSNRTTEERWGTRPGANQNLLSNSRKRERTDDDGPATLECDGDGIVYSDSADYEDVEDSNEIDDACASNASSSAASEAKQQKTKKPTGLATVCQRMTNAEMTIVKEIVRFL